MRMRTETAALERGSGTRRALQEKLERIETVVLSVVLPLWNVARLVARLPGAKQFAVGVTGLRGTYVPGPLRHQDIEEIIAAFAPEEGHAATIRIPFYSGEEGGSERGSTGGEKLLTMAALLRLHRSSTALEIGTYKGIGTLWIAANLEEGGLCHTLDLPVDEALLPKIRREADRRLAEPGLRSSRVFHGHPLATRIVEHFGDSKEFDFSSLGSRFDFVYIDGEHSLDAISSDTLNAFRLLSDRGFIVWDDYLPFHLSSHPEVRRFIHWFDTNIDRLYDIGGQAAWYARLSSITPSEIVSALENSLGMRQ